MTEISKRVGRAAGKVVPPDQMVMVSIGEIDMEELERRLDQLVRTEPELIREQRPESHDG